MKRNVLHLIKIFPCENEYNVSKLKEMMRMIICELENILFEMNKGKKTSEKIRQIHIANALKLRPASVSLIVRGEQIPSLENALLIARYLNRPVEDIWRLDEETLKSFGLN